MGRWGRFLSLVLLPAAGLAAAQAGDVPLATVVRFNTACAKCHEGECSGRLSFDRDDRAADGHIRRYAGAVADDVRRDLVRLLAHMKQACAHYPMPVDVPRDGRWPAASLAFLRSAADNAYFIPLGELPAGRYRATLRFDGAAEGCAQIVSAAFDIAERPGLRSQGGAAALEFAVERPGRHYLRLQLGGPVALTGLELRPNAP